MKPYIEMYRRWIAVPGIHAADIAVLSALYAHAGGDGVCTVTQGQLAEELGQSRAWIHAVLKTLQEPAVSLVATRTRRGFRGFLYELAGTNAGDTDGQSADSKGLPADRPLETQNPWNPESSSFQREGIAALPIDWTPNADDIAWAGQQRPDVDPGVVTGKFVAWCRKAHRRNGYSPADPSAAWRRWIGRELVAPAPTSATAPADPHPVPSSPSPRREFHHEHRLHRSCAERPAGAGVVARNHDTLAALRNRLAGTA